MIPPTHGLSANEAKELEAALRRGIDGEVRFDDGSRALYASDLSMYRQVPIGVVIPKSIDDVVHTMTVCRDRQVPVLGRGCGTSLAGQTCNIAVVIDFSKYLNNILELNAQKKYAWSNPVINEIAQCCGKAQADLGARSGYTRILHAGRNDRQQLLRCALGHGRQNGR